jgi:cytidylate kinase
VTGSHQPSGLGGGASAEAPNQAAEPVQDDRIITIDGPAGSGKSTLCQNLAAALGWRHLDTGAIYRAVAVAAVEMRVESPMEAQLLAEGLDIRVEQSKAGSRVWLGGREVTSQLRDPRIGQLSSHLSAIPGVRSALLRVQRAEGEKGRLVCEGRDMGTVVFPWARLKFFLHAQLPERAKRRMAQLAQEGVTAHLWDVMTSIADRDNADASRDVAPMRAAPGAVVIDSTNMSLFEVETKMLGHAARAFGADSAG